ncbi:MAG: hypothetical protein CMI56_02955 [Parcubacteria group bacterium]|nr:hypothetical protein [Parcubacteria group bacterium]|tara:strand:+ start:1041 stop:1430 length:390 start_codon:yes stop_codon:yes gene_type:complete
MAMPPEDLCKIFFKPNDFSSRFGVSFFTATVPEMSIEDDVVRYEICLRAGDTSWSVLRRYSEFETLSKKISNCEKFPPKTWSRSSPKDVKFLSERRVKLEMWLVSTLSSSKEIVSNTKIREFLRLDELK